MFRKYSMVLFIATDITCNLFFPELYIFLRPYIILATFMTVPEAAIHKNYGSVFREDNVWLFWKPGIVFPVTKPLSKQILSDYFFRFGVFTTNAGHIVAALLQGMYICRNNPSQVNLNNTLSIFDGKFWRSSTCCLYQE